MTENDAKAINELLQRGDIILISTKNSSLAKIIQDYEHDTNREKFLIYANHIVQVYDDTFCLDQHFPIASFSKFREKYFTQENELIIIRPNLDYKERDMCQKMMLGDAGTFYGVLQIIGFMFYWLSIKIFKKKIENFLDLKSVEICSLSVFRRLIAISDRFNIAGEEYKSDEGLVTPQDFLRACKINNNFKIMYSTAKFI